MLSEGFDSAEVKAQPSDIIAQKDGETWYFEIKLTDHQDTCFGAATLTDRQRKRNKRLSAIPMTEQNFRHMLQLFKQMRSE